MYGSYGGMGGYGAGMGGYGGGMGGMYGGMQGGMPGDPNNPDSLTNRFNMSTQATFQMLEGVVGAFGGFAQMLESTYMATHSSFFGKSVPDYESRRDRVLTSSKPWSRSPSNSAIYGTPSAPCWESSP